MHEADVPAMIRQSKAFRNQISASHRLDIKMNSLNFMPYANLYQLSAL